MRSHTSKGFLQKGVPSTTGLTTRGSYNQKSYNKGILQPGILTKRSSYEQKSYHQGFLPRATRGLTTRGSYHDQPSVLTNRVLKTRGSYNKGSLQPTSSFTTRGLQLRVLKFKSSYIKGF